MPRPSRDYLPLLEHICDEFLATGSELSPYNLPRGLPRHNLTLLQTLSYVRIDNDRIVPTRNGMRRAARVNLLERVAELMRHLQATSESWPTGETWTEDMVAKLVGWDEKTASAVMILLHGAPGVITPFRPGGGIFLVLGHGFGDADATRVGALEPEFEAPRNDLILLLRYGEGERVFPEVFITRGQFEGSNLEGIRIGGGRLEDTNLFGCNLRGATLGTFPPAHGLGYFGLSLAGSDLGRAELHGADLRGAKLDGARIEGARLDRRTLLPADGRASAVWEVLYVDDQPRRREEPWDAIEPEPDEGYRMVHEPGNDKWEIRHRGKAIAVIDDSIGARIAAVLLANPGREIHALDLDGEVGRVPFAPRPLGELLLESTDAEELMRSRGLPVVIDLTHVELQRLRACLRACARLETEGDGPNLLDDLHRALRARRLPLGGLARARVTTDRLRKAFDRARTGDLAGNALAPVVRAIQVAEFCRYAPPGQ